MEEYEYHCLAFELIHCPSPLFEGLIRKNLKSKRELDFVSISHKLRQAHKRISTQKQATRDSQFKSYRCKASYFENPPKKVDLNGSYEREQPGIKPLTGHTHTLLLASQDIMITMTQVVDLDCHTTTQLFPFSDQYMMFPT